MSTHRTCLTGLFAALCVALVARTSAAESQTAPRHAPAQSQSGQSQANAIADDVVRRLYIVSDLHWHKGEYVRLVNVNRMIIAAKPTFVGPYIDAGWLLWSMNRNDEAEALYDQGIAANPDTYAIYSEKGFFLLNRRKDAKRGLAALEAAVSKPDCAKIVLHSLAHAYERNGMLEKALATWNGAADDPQNPGRAVAKVNRDRVRRLLESRR